MGNIQLNEREQLIERILRMPDEQIAALAEFAEDLEEALDPAIIEARKSEPAITLDDYLRQSGLSRENVEATARAEGWIK
jgi:hypothetical protein